MKIKPIKNEKDYEKALERVEKLWGAKENTLDGDEFEILFTLIEKYEDEHYPIPPPKPIEAIKFQMDQLGLTQTDMVRYLGHKSRVSDVLRGKRKLSLRMIRSLNKNLKIPVETLIKEY